jgi:inhibitor of cysteine peptidase
MSRIKMTQLLFASAALLLIAAAACSPGATPTTAPAGPQPTTPPAGAPPTNTPAKPQGATVTGLASVASIDLLTLESFPVQIHVVARGNLRDGCTTIDQITQTREGNSFKVTITTIRPANQMCTQAIVPFEQTIALDVYGLKAGTYAVDVNGVTGTFTLDVNNEL